MKGLILAGGFATRLGAIGEVFPKAMLMVEGNTLVGHLLSKLERLGIETVITTNRRFAEFFRSYPHVLVEEATREEEKLGAVTAIANAIRKEEIREDLLVVCADNYFSSDLRGFVSSYQGDPTVGVYYAGGDPGMRLQEMATVKFCGSESYPPPTQSFCLEDFKEKVDPPLSPYVSTGLYLFPPKIFPILLEYSAEKKRDAPGFFIQHLMERGITVRGYLLGGEWFDASYQNYLLMFKDSKLVRRDEDLIQFRRESGGMVMLLSFLRKGGMYYVSKGERLLFFIEGGVEMKMGMKRMRVRGREVVEIPPGEEVSLLNPSHPYSIFLSLKWE
ncbi:MAG: sugar phosphate nucleotidyltransferase [Candidatus Hadarchaeales archaeon]